MIDACPEPAVLFFDVDGTLTSFDPDNMTDKDFSAVRPRRRSSRRFIVCATRDTRRLSARVAPCGSSPIACVRSTPAGVVAMAGATLEVEGRVVYEDCFDEDIVEELARRMAAAGIEAFFETNVATFALEPAGVEQSSRSALLWCTAPRKCASTAVCAWAR